MRDKKGGNAIFKLYSRGVGTGRDSWAYNSSKSVLAENMKRHVEYCNSQILRNPKTDSTKAQRTSDLASKLKKSKPKFSKNNIRIALYRPFFKQYLYFDKTYTQATNKIPLFFPNNASKNMVICIAYKSPNVDFSALVTDVTPDLHIHPMTHCFPLYVYENNKKLDNISNFALELFQEHYRDKTITKKDIFYYVYALLHHPRYKKRFANNLAREQPRITLAPDFRLFSNMGRKLADLHLNYETTRRYKLGKPLGAQRKSGKLSFGDKYVTINNRRRQIPDTTKLFLNGILLFDSIPEIKYQISDRTPLEWVVDRYKKSTDKRSGIINDPTDTDIIQLVERTVYVGVESDKIISKLSEADFTVTSWEPPKMNLDRY